MREDASMSIENEATQPGRKEQDPGSRPGTLSTPSTGTDLLPPGLALVTSLSFLDMAVETMTPFSEPLQGVRAQRCNGLLGASVHLGKAAAAGPAPA